RELKETPAFIVSCADRCDTAEAKTPKLETLFLSGPYCPMAWVESLPRSRSKKRTAGRSKRSSSHGQRWEQSVPLRPSSMANSSRLSPALVGFRGSRLRYLSLLLARHYRVASSTVPSDRY